MSGPNDTENKRNIVAGQLATKTDLPQPFDDAESTDVSKAGDMATPDGKKSRGGMR